MLLIARSKYTHTLQYGMSTTSSPKRSVACLERAEYVETTYETHHAYADQTRSRCKEWVPLLLYTAGTEVDLQQCHTHRLARTW